MTILFNKSNNLRLNKHSYQKDIAVFPGSWITDVLPNTKLMLNKNYSVRTHHKRGLKHYVIIY